MRAPAVEPTLARLHLDSLDDESELVGASVTGDVSGADAAHVELTGCLITGVRLTGARLESLRVTDSVFEDCDLSGALLRGAALTRVALRNCRMSGVVMDQCRLRDVTMDAGKLDDANLGMTVGEHVVFQGCILRGASFAGAKLRPGARFYDCDLSGADFAKADLTGARLHGSVLDRLKGADSLAGVVIGPDQAIPLALLLLAGRAIAVEDRDGPLPG